MENKNIEDISSDNWYDKFCIEMCVTSQHSASKATAIWLNNNVITPLELENSHLKLVINAAEQRIAELKKIIEVLGTTH